MAENVEEQEQEQDLYRIFLEECYAYLKQARIQMHNCHPEGKEGVHSDDIIFSRRMGRK